MFVISDLNILKGIHLKTEISFKDSFLGDSQTGWSHNIT